MSTSNSSAKVELSSNIPNWLDTLFREEFFDPCLSHPRLKQNEKNIFCLDCCMSFCSNCSSSHFGHQVLQIRKYNDHRVVRAEDMEKLINCSLVQSYMLNRALVVFLKERSPSKKKEEEKAHNQSEHNKKKVKTRKLHFQNCDKICSSCTRSLKEEYDYCSVTCMVKGVMRTEGSIVGHLRECRILPLPSNLEDSHEEHGNRIVNCLQRKRRNNEETSPCVFVSVHRRKGVPRRSPLC